MPALLPTYHPAGQVMSEVLSSSSLPTSALQAGGKGRSIGPVQGGMSCSLNGCAELRIVPPGPPGG